MNGDFIFRSAQREWEEPLEDDYEEDEEPSLPDEGLCPFCHEELAWDGMDDTKAWCKTPKCKYDNGISEDDNRRMWEEGQR